MMTAIIIIIIINIFNSYIKLILWKSQIGNQSNSSLGLNKTRKAHHK